MANRENVINKVTAIVADMQEEVDEWKDYSDSELRGGLTCDCDWWYKTLQTLKDALALLKAQEPRVMDFDDVVGGDECWLEAINGACGYADCYACTGTGEVQVFRCKFDNPQYIMAGDYLKTWRCWTSRPTDEQRKETAWPGV